MALTEAGAMALSAVGSLGSNLSGGLFNINQARKNRSFQERMFNRQVEVNRENWQMENEYNLPSAQMQRLKDANLNPYLMYGEGGSGLTSQGSIGNPTAPSGAQAQVHFTNPFLDALQAKLATAQVDKLEAETQKTKSETDWQNIENRFSTETYMVRKAIQFGNWDMLKISMDKLRQDMYNSVQLTTQQVLTMMQGREYEIKRFRLDEYQVGESVKQGWENVVTGKIQASAAIKQAFAAMQNAANAARLTTAQIGQISLNMSQQREMFPLLKANQTESNWQQIQQRMLNGVHLTQEQKKSFEMELDNRLKAFGAGPETYVYKFAAPWIMPVVRGNYNYSTSSYK